MKRLAALLLGLALSACGTSDSDAPVRVSIIGDKAKLIDPNSGLATRPSLALSGAIAQGLVQFNPAGEVVPALAESWMVTDDGLSYIFRISRQNWADGKRVSAFEVAASLRASLGNGSRNPNALYLAGITDILAMTDRIIEVRLARPMPNLLQYLARPEMAVMHKGRGSGPMRIVETGENALNLRPVLTQEQAETLTKAELDRITQNIRGESPAKAIARYAKGDAALVLGGSFSSLPYLFEAKLPRDIVRRDPVSGLFGLVVSANSTALADAESRRALAIAIDRPALMSAFGMSGWNPVEVPAMGFADTKPLLDVSQWTSVDLAERRKRARSLLGRKLEVKILLPEGPGSKILLARLKADFAAIGVSLARTIEQTAADLVLVDEAAPVASFDWYVARLSCGRGIKCSSSATKLRDSLQEEASLEERKAADVEAAQAILKDQIFLPLATPLRWSLARPELNGFRENTVNVHPLVWLRRTKG